MNKAIDFYFDFSSLYSYIGHLRIEELANKHDRAINWIPFSLGVVFKELNIPMPVQAKLDYAIKKDLPRYSKEYAKVFQLPSPFPFNSIPASRAMLWLKASDPELAIRFAKKIFASSFEQGLDCSEADTLNEIASSLSIDAGELNNNIADEPVKKLLKRSTNDALQAEIFGAPTFIIDGEMFWGSDRIDQIDRWLSQGGW